MLSSVTSFFDRTRGRGLAVVFLTLLASLGFAAAAFAQTNPAAQSLPYTQNFASLTPATVTTLPAGWASWTIGTAASAHVKIRRFVEAGDDAQNAIAPEHARIDWRGGRIFITDLSNGLGLRVGLAYQF